MSEIARRDFHVETADGVRVAVREVRTKDGNSRVPMVLLHGTRIPGLSEYDLPVPNGSLAADLAAKGHVVYILDARGYGRSERPAEMEAPPVPGADALCRTIEITRDVVAAADHLRAATSWNKVGLFGWGVGATCCAMSAALWPDKISHLVLYSMVYGGTADIPNFSIGSKFDDPANPGHFNRKAFGNYSVNTLDLLDSHWDGLIPIKDKRAWRDPAMLAAFRQALLDGDPTSKERELPSYRSPNGMLEDLFIMGATAQRLLHASQIYARVMIVRPEFDNLCQESDMTVFINDLVHAEEIVHFAPPNTTQYMLLDRPERGRNELLARMANFLDTASPPA